MVGCGGAGPALTLLSSFTARRGCQPCGDPLCARPGPARGPHGVGVAEPSRRAVAAAVGCLPGGASSFGLCWSQPRSPLPGRPPPFPTKVRGTARCGRAGSPRSSSFAFLLGDMSWSPCSRGRGWRVPPAHPQCHLGCHPAAWELVPLGTWHMLSQSGLCGHRSGCVATAVPGDILNLEKNCGKPRPVGLEEDTEPWELCPLLGSLHVTTLAPL